MKKFLFVLVLLSQVALPAFGSGESEFNRIRSFDVIHYKIGLKFNRTRKRITGDSSITLQPLDRPLTSVELDSKRISYTSITQEDTGEALTYRTTATKLTVDLARPLPVGQKLTIRFRYTATPKKGIYFVKALREKGKRIRPAQIWTQGEAEETSHWLPSYDFPDDKATSEQLITVGASESVIGNGKLRSNKLNRDGSRTFHFEMEKPFSLYLTSFVVGTYTKVSDRKGALPLDFFVYPGQTAIANRAFGQTRSMLSLFEEKTGVAYPFSKYDQTIVARFPFGGMENITATTFADSEILNLGNKAGRDNVQDLVAHELAHSWFGNLVTCRNWAELWINESFASYMEAVYREKKNGRDDYFLKIREDASEYFSYSAASESADHGLFNRTADPENDLTMFDPVTYNKGSAVIHTLREELGDEVFWKAINVYLVKFSYKNVETKDIKSVFEEVSGRDLDWFFEQWIYRTGHPEIGINTTFDKETGDLTLEFVQLATKSENPVDLYRLPLDIDVSTSQGKFSETLIFDERSEKVVINTKIAPQLIEIDKHYKVPIKSVSQSRIRIK